MCGHNIYKTPAAQTIRSTPFEEQATVNGLVVRFNMRLLVSFSLTAVTALAICTFGEPKVLSTKHAVQPASPRPHLSEQRSNPILTGIDIFFSPYRLLNLDRSSYERPPPAVYDTNANVWITEQEMARLNKIKNNQDSKNNDKKHHLYGSDSTDSDFPEYGPDGGLAITYDYNGPRKFRGEKMWSPDLKSKKAKNTQTDFNLKYASTKPKDERQQTFALSPRDKGYFDKSDNFAEEETEMHYMMRRGDGYRVESIAPVFHDMRQVRQNPHKVKTLVQDLPNDKELSRSEARARNAGDSTVGDIQKVHVFPNDDDVPASLYAIAIFTAMGAALCIAVIGVGYGWYTLSTRAKAAADVDYPAYGVTGPGGDHSADRKLAQSAHMYHYQHQKQQIIAMERNVGAELGSLSDAESEEENEEGDYTVYECPGYATTGDMEVKNPMFSDDQTTATPAAASPAIVVNCDVD